ncbi:MAG: carboxymuconolactone decarboxylase family protein [Blastocatellia bacterium]|nr:carboxymuconolactone decarboxylase family protein [Blastocatellia bacterium]
MSEIERLRERLPEPAKDIRLNLQSIFQSSVLTQEQIWGTAVASVLASRNKMLAQAVLNDMRGKVDAKVIEDAMAAAALMGMNNVYYRFRHMVGKESYSSKPARLRMNWIARPQSSKVDFELFCLAASAINGCESCIRSHEEAVVNGEITEDQVNDVIRIAATINGAAVALEMADFDENSA